LLEHGSGKLERLVRFLCTDLWPTLYHLLSLQEQDGLRVWKLPKPAALALLRQESQLAQTAHTFYQALHLVRKKARSALLAVPGLLRTHPWNDQIASESAHGIPKFTLR
jgi:hypothetical protein